MRAFWLVAATLLLSYASCNRTELKEKECPEGQLANVVDVIEQTEKPKFMDTSTIDLYGNVKTNLILCDNVEFTIRVDRLINDSLRYVCWKKPKSVYNTPDFIIGTGIKLENSSDDRQEYLFSNINWNYSVEKIISKDESRTVHIFLEVRNTDGKENYAWKMRDLSNTNAL